jgi:hypothetical protein
MLFNSLTAGLKPRSTFLGVLVDSEKFVVSEHGAASLSIMSIDHSKTLRILP